MMRETTGRLAIIMAVIRVLNISDSLFFLFFFAISC